MRPNFTQICGLFFFFNILVGYSQVTLNASLGSPTGSYSNLKETFDRINDGTHQGDITIQITADITENVTAVLNNSGAGFSNYTSVTITPSGGAPRIVSGNLASNGLIYLNGADYVTIDGLNTLGNALIFENENPAAPTIKFSSNSNASENNLITNCTILGATSSSYSGVILFQWASNNVLSDNVIGPFSNNNPANLIYAGYFYAGDSNFNSITGNDLSDYGNSSATRAAAIYLEYGTNWTINNNTIFQSSARSFNNPSFNRYYGIYVRNGSGHQINNNIIGYSSASQTGITQIDLSGAASSVDLYPIHFTSDGSTESNIENNVISEFSISGTTQHIGFYPIFYEGTYNSSASILRNARISNNLVGSETKPNAITLNTGGNMRFRAILLGNPGSSLNYLYDVTINNNRIGGIQVPTTGSSLGYFNGITTKGYAGSIVRVTENTIGFPSAPIQIGDNPTSSQYSYSGIYVSYNGYEHVTLEGNTIQNLRSYSTNYSSQGIELFKYNPTNTYVITDNTVRSLQAEGELSGIKSNYNPSGSLYADNKIYDLLSNHNTYGMY
ncbi:MAG: hypothetical protein KJO20_10265, partial [Eudoraea sp.]|nr:hypothetical protein [Eudoraea sp.]MBT8269181.1 hypothetical protein [Bacteroidia bacterium]